MSDIVAKREITEVQDIADHRRLMELRDQERLFGRITDRLEWEPGKAPRMVRWEPRAPGSTEVA
jgi:hypothetical protein